jgi:hypothetical protein
MLNWLRWRRLLPRLVASSRRNVTRKRSGLSRRALRHEVTQLETRMLLALSGVGNEFLINATTAGFQAEADVATDNAGNFAVAWNDDTNVFVRRFDVNGQPQSAETQLSTASNANETHFNPSVAMDADGDFVVAWNRDNFTDYVYDVFARTGSSNGNLGAVQTANANTSNDDRSSGVAMDADGDFTVVWERYKYGSNRNTYDIPARRFSVAGAPQGNESGVDQAAAGVPVFEPAVGRNAVGTTVIAWTQESDGFDVFVRVFDGEGQDQFNAIVANQTTAGTQATPSVAINDDGTFVVVWAGNGAGDDIGVFARLFAADGTPQGGEILVNGTTAGNQLLPDVAVDPNHNFVVTWNGNGTGDALGVFLRCFDDTGQPQSDETIVNTTTTNVQGDPAVAIGGNGEIVVVWSGNGNGDADGVFGRLFTKTVVSIEASDPNAAEDGSGTGEFVISRTGRTTADLDVFVTISGTATDVVDYARTGMFTIPAGSTTTTITIAPVNDGVPETDETVVFTIDPNAAYTVGAPGNSTVTIDDSGLIAPIVSIQATDPVASETGSDTGEFVLTRIGVVTFDLDVAVTISGTAADGVDYMRTGIFTIPAGSASTTITITPVNDGAGESDETVVFTIDPNAAYTVGVPSTATVVIGDAGSVTPTVIIQATDPDAHEAGGNVGEFVIARTGDTTNPLVVLVTIGGTATDATDYTRTGVFTIPAGSATVTITITPTADTEAESDETVVLTIDPSAGYNVGSPNSATVTIGNNDTTGPTVNDVRFTADAKRVMTVILTFSEALDETEAEDEANYAITVPGKKPRNIPVTAAQYNAATFEVTLTLGSTAKADVLKKNVRFNLTVNGTASVQDAAGNILDGDEDGDSGGDFQGGFIVGNKINYIDNDGDKVSLKLKGPGEMQIWLTPAAGARRLRFVGTTAANTVLSGKVAGAGDGATTIDDSIGLNTVQDNLPDTFTI